MNCPNCNTPNPPETKICQSCSHELADSDTTEQKNIIVMALMLCLRWLGKIIRLATLPVLLGILDPILGGILGLGAITRASIMWRAKKKGRIIKTNSWLGVRITGWIILFALGIILNLDAPSIKQYTIADLHSAAPEYAESYALLESLSVTDDSEIPQVIGLTIKDVDSIDLGIKDDLPGITDSLLNKEEMLEAAWGRAKKGRVVIDKLAQFEEIADLTEPKLDVEMNYFKSLKHLVRLYSSHAMLQCEKGNSNEAVSELNQIDNIFRKLSVNSRGLITRLVCIAGMARDIHSANYIANHPNTSEYALEMLAGHFSPITKDQISMQNMLKAESIIFQTEHKNINSEIYEFQDGSMKMRRYFKPNSSLRLHRNLMQEALLHDGMAHGNNTKMTVWPWRNPELLPVSFGEDYELPLHYYYYNPIGSMLVAMMESAFGRVNFFHVKLKIHDDLLQVVLGLRLGRVVDLSARAYGDEYVIDVDRKMIYSPGPDGEAFTDDDIKLYINPEVLGLKEAVVFGS